MTAGKTIALTIQIFVGKVMSLLLDTLSSFSVCHGFSSKEQVSFNFMAAVPVCSDFGAQENKVSHCFHCFPIYSPWSSFFECWVLSQLLSLSSFTFIKKLFSSSSLSVIRVVSSAYLRLLIFLLAILIPACDSFCTIYSAYKLNKAGWQYIALTYSFPNFETLHVEYNLFYTRPV